MEALHILTDDGHMLAGRCFRPHGGVHVRRAVIIACALGVPQIFYERYASWLVQHGCVATLVCPSPGSATAWAASCSG